jgi:hypothetical protein
MVHRYPSLGVLRNAIPKRTHLLEVRLRLRRDRGIGVAKQTRADQSALEIQMKGELSGKRGKFQPQFREVARQLPRLQEPIHVLCGAEQLSVLSSQVIG